MVVWSRRRQRVFVVLLFTGQLKREVGTGWLSALAGEFFELQVSGHRPSLMGLVILCDFLLSERIYVQREWENKSWVEKFTFPHKFFPILMGIFFSNENLKNCWEKINLLNFFYLDVFIQFLFSMSLIFCPNYLPGYIPRV